MKPIKYEEDCRIPFNLSCLYKRGSCKGAELRMKDGRILQVPIPYEVRYACASYTRWLKSEDGQNMIEKQLNNNTFRLW
jgi:hypothetical protein